MSTIKEPFSSPASLPLNEENTSIEIVTGDKLKENNEAIRCLSIIIPAYNEENTISLILDRINEVKLIRNIEKEVIIVNDCSTDNTEAAVQNYMNNTANLTINYQIHQT